MIIAIHHRKGSFSERWIEYCQQHGIEYKLVDAYQSDIVEQVKGCDAFMWHHHHADYRDALFAKQLICSLETAGIRCFPNAHTTWHFDDKVGQKYLLESVGAPLVPSYVFYTKKDALDWISKTTFPKVFKLRGGAGASNVKLAHTAKEARRFVKKAFGRGFSQFDRAGYLKDHFRKWREGKDSFKGVLKGVERLFVVTDYAKMHGREKGYAYFQEFIPNNYFDIRIIVIGNKAFAIKRMVRKGDFRASGSGNIIYDRNEIPEACVKTSFEVSKKLVAQCLAYDYVFDADGKPAIVEVSYGFTMHGYNPCPGYWTEDLQWHEVTFNPQEWMVQDLVNQNLDSVLTATNAGGGKLLNNNELQSVFRTNNISISNKLFDLRVVVIGNKAMGEKRFARKGDFRASGSGQFEYVPLREDVLQIAFNAAKQLQMQSVAFDFIFRDNEPLIVEVSYGFGTKGISHCPGYYTSDSQWHGESEPDFCGWMVEELINH